MAHASMHSHNPGGLIRSLLAQLPSAHLGRLGQQKQPSFSRGIRRCLNSPHTAQTERQEGRGKPLSLLGIHNLSG